MQAPYIESEPFLERSCGCWPSMLRSLRIGSLALATRAMGTSIHTYAGKTIAGDELSMSALAGKPVLMLNVASR